MTRPPPADAPVRTSAVRPMEGHETAMRALRALRPLIDASSLSDLARVVRDFSGALGAVRYALGIVERAPGGNALRWLCEDAPRWWLGFRREFAPLVSRSGSRGGPQIRAVRRALDDPNDAPAHAELRKLGGYSVLFLVAEALHPGDMAACLALLFASGSRIALPAAQAQLAGLCNHAASIVLDTYLRLPVRAAPRVRLSARESECLRWASVGKTSWETALILGVTERTVNFHLGNAFGKLKVNNKQAAVAQAILQGLL
ncbi:MAG: helix-turn-helix domain-containing protein [Pigmentiphaga sp.]|uniref:helix-turn-helix transcriptional regulator n=1 Tax=Pigmentiphaga sp. TaxID=1977564 RepID=UPI0029AA8416|nr:helix-turn-helix domain-containing protein [Pigmentiphaga sp.]MDX3906423.1 helix-turn-helix domain-containing protein [Pigmentiphaga sp.]